VRGEIFRTCPDRPWGPPSLLYNGYRVFPRGKGRPGRDAEPSSPSIAVVMKGRAIPLLPLWTVRPVQSLSACTRVHFTFIFTLGGRGYVTHSPRIYTITRSSSTAELLLLLLFFFFLTSDTFRPQQADIKEFCKHNSRQHSGLCTQYTCTSEISIQQTNDKTINYVWNPPQYLDVYLQRNNTGK